MSKFTSYSLSCEAVIKLKEFLLANVQSVIQEGHKDRKLPGIFLVHDSKLIAPVAQDILLIATCSNFGEWTLK
jgi:ABC-type dipeptide/oligopeptide/nickel transport system ATPase subunit